MASPQVELIRKVIKDANKLQCLQEACAKHGTYEHYVFYLIQRSGFILEKERKPIITNERACGDKPTNKVSIDVILNTLETTKGNVTKARKLCGLSRVGFYDALRRNGIELKTYYTLIEGANKNLLKWEVIIKEIVKDANELGALEPAYKKNNTYRAIVDYYLGRLNRYIKLNRYLEGAQSLSYTNRAEMKEVIDSLSANNCDVNQTAFDLYYHPRAIRFKLRKYGLTIKKKYTLEDVEHDNN